MSNVIGYGVTAIRHGEQRASEALVNLMKATQNKPGERPVTVVESKPPQNVGTQVDIKA